GFDGPEGGTAGGSDVFDDDDAVAGIERTFDEFGGSVRFGFLANEESTQFPALLTGEREHCADDRISSHRHSPHGFERRLPQLFEHARGDQCRSDRGEGDLATVDVVRRLLTARQRELAKLKRIRFDSVEQSLSVVSHRYPRSFDFPHALGWTIDASE